MTRGYHQVYAWNLAQTGQWAFVPRIPSAAATSPLYIVLLALGYWLHTPYLLWTFSLGALFLAMGGWFGARLAEQLFPAQPQIGLWAGLTIVLAWHFIWASASGMETMLFVALALLDMWLVVLQTNTELTFRKRFWQGIVFGVSAALTIATRPEGYLLAAILVSARIFTRPGGLRGLTVWIIGAVIGGAIFYAPLALLNLSLNGTLLPNTVAAKQAQNIPLLGRPFLVNLWSMIEPMLPGVQLALLPAFVVGLWMVLTERRKFQFLYLTPILWGVALLLLYTLRLPGGYQHSRYIMSSLLSLMDATRIRYVLIRSYMLILVGLLAWFWAWGANVFGTEVLQIDGEMVKMAQWIEANIPPDQLLAVYDIGAIGYYASGVSQPRPLLDMAGLLNPEIIQYFYHPSTLLQIMQAVHVRWLIILPHQWTELWMGNEQSLSRQFCERYNTGGPLGGMRVYEYVPNGKCS